MGPTEQTTPNWRDRRHHINAIRFGSSLMAMLDPQDVSDIEVSIHNRNDGSMRLNIGLEIDPGKTAERVMDACTVTAEG